MRCIECGLAMQPAKGNFRYEPVAGLRVTLIGLTSYRDENGHVAREIPALAGLHRALAGAIVRKHSRLAPSEIRFLRKSLGWSGKDFASYIGVTPESVSRWENGHDEMGPQADRLLRLLAVNKQPIEDYALEGLKAIGRRTTGPIRVGFELKGKEWATAKAA